MFLCSTRGPKRNRAKTVAAPTSMPAIAPAALARRQKASIRAGARLCAARLLRAGVDLAGYSMPETVDDQELARRALGYGPIDLLGGSYGTRLELIYEWRYPASLRRVVMIGANPPGHFVRKPGLTDAKLARYRELLEVDSEITSAATWIAVTSPCT